MLEQSRDREERRKTVKWLLKVLGLYIDESSTEDAAKRLAGAIERKESEICSSEIEQQCLDFIKSRVPGFTRLGDLYGELDIRFVPMPGYEEERGWVCVENSHGKVGVRMTSNQGGEYERFVRSCLQLAKIGTIWIGFSSKASVLLNMDRLKFMDQGETFESMKIKFDLDN